MRTPGSISCLLLVFLALTSISLPGARASGQEPDTLRIPLVEERQEDSPPEVHSEGITPRGAFIRSMLLPGWGHAEVEEALVRGGFYFSAQSATLFMILKSHTRLNLAKERLKLMESVVRQRLEADGVTDPRALEAAVSTDERVEGLRALEASRSEQRQDWIALGLFLVFLSGADAFVAAHLADFPAAVEIEPTPAGALQIGFSVPVSF